MRTNMRAKMRTTKALGNKSSAPRERGFSLIELLVAMGMFMVISAAAISLFRQQQIASEGITGTAGLNLALRNTVSQLQMDLANAGSGYFVGVNMPSWPVGVTVNNRVVAAGNSCYNAGTFTYGANCFDQLNVIAADPATPPVHATDSTGAAGAGNCSLTSSGTAYAQAATGLTLAQTAAKFSVGDQLLFMNNTGLLITTAVLIQPTPAVVGGAVKLTFNATNANGTNTGGPNGANDPLDITTCDGNLGTCSLVTNNPPAIVPKLTNKFCASDWILKLAPIIYKVDIVTDPANPRLTRQIGTNGVPISVMDQVIGFKVGATIWNGSLSAVSGNYNYDASSYADNGTNRGYNFSLVRSVRVSLIGRTVPDRRGTYKFRNGFDNGPYQVQGVAVVVNPRNLSMND